MIVILRAVSKKVLFVCLGNICRSPLAEALFLKNVQNSGLQEFFQADSCGTSNYHIGDLPDPRSYENAKSNGVTIDHKGRQLTYEDLLKFDYILAMDSSNMMDIQSLAQGHPDEGEIRLMRDFDPTVSHPADVPDPYYGGANGFQDVFDILDRSTMNFLHSLQQK